MAAEKKETRVVRLRPGTSRKFMRIRQLTRLTYTEMADMMADHELERMRAMNFPGIVASQPDGSYLLAAQGPIQAMPAEDDEDADKDALAALDADLTAARRNRPRRAERAVGNG